MISPALQSDKYSISHIIFNMKSIFLKQDFQIRLRLGYSANSDDNPCKNARFSDFSGISSCKTTKNKLLPIDFQAFLS